MGKMRGADRGSKFHLKFSQFPSTEEAVDYLVKLEPNCNIIGVEITDGATAIQNIDFKCKPTAFIFGNEGKGLSEKQRSICHEFVYIPQFSTGLASINVACASAVILHHYAVASSFKETKHINGKFM
jgi:tRNA G18 (ribose-2'-O)-methylase SpoU